MKNNDLTESDHNLQYLQSDKEKKNNSYISSIVTNDLEEKRNFLLRKAQKIFILSNLYKSKYQSTG